MSLDLIQIVAKYSICRVITILYKLFIYLKIIDIFDTFFLLFQDLSNSKF